MTICAQTQTVHKEVSIHFDWSQVNCVIYEEDKGTKHWKDIKNVVKQYVEQLSFSSYTEKEISITFPFNEHTYIEVQKLSLENEHSRYICSLLNECLKKPFSHIQEFYEYCTPVRITSYSRNDLKIGYSVLNDSIKESRHGKRWKRREEHHEYYRIFDFHTLLTDTLCGESLCDFILSNRISLKQELVKQLLELNEKRDEMIVPCSNQFYLDIIPLLRMHFPHKKKEVKFKPLERFKPLFYFLESKTAYGVEDFLCFPYLQMILPSFFKTLPNLQIIQKKKKTKYAKIYETKKNIPSSILKRMDTSPILGKYGFVEYDNSLSMEKIDEIERDFCELMSHFSFPNSKAYSIRFRKLGKQKLEGLFFPTKRCIIVDIQHSDSFVHELAHQIDDMYKQVSFLKQPLSEDRGFLHIVHEYIKLVQPALFHLDYKPSDITYYFNRKEIFARAFELYIYHKGVQNSLVNTSFSQPEIYPQDPAFISLITTFFEDIFPF